jgi:hypothetical protein
MTVLEVVLNFRAALLGVIPAFEKANIPWRRPDAYDEWDSVASALFETLVSSVLTSRVPETMRESFQLPQYDLLLPGYAALSTIEVLTPQLPRGPRYIFHALGTNTEPLDSLEVRRLSANGEPDGVALEIVPLREVSLLLRVVNPTTGTEIMLID